MVDAADLKSASREGVWVRVPPSALQVVSRVSFLALATSPLVTIKVSLVCATVRLNWKQEGGA